MGFGCSNLPFFPTAPGRDGAKAVPEGWRDAAVSHNGDRHKEMTVCKEKEGAGRCQAYVCPCFHWAHPN